jgi:hypothetical protein
MPHVYREVAKLQGADKVDGGECVRLVQHFTKVGHTTTWRMGERVLDARTIPIGTVIANFTKQGRWPGLPKGNHAAFFMGFGPLGPDGKPTAIYVMDQWTGPKKPKISARSILRRGSKRKSEGNFYDDSDNAEHFYVVK